MARKENMVEKLSKEKLLGWFFILWGLSHLLNSVGWLGLYVIGNGALAGMTDSFIAISMLDMLIGTAMGFVLIVLGQNILKAKQG